MITSNGFNKSDLIKRYLQWWNDGAFDTGPTFAMVFQSISEGAPYNEASKIINDKLDGATAGCGPAHRASPLAGYNKIPTNKLIQYSREEAKITHYHPLAGDCSAIVVMLCRHLLEGYSWDQCKKLISKNKELKNTWKEVMSANLNNGGYVLDVMHSAIHFLNEKDSLKKSLIFAGSANYCSVIVGTIQNLIDQQSCHR